MAVLKSLLCRYHVFAVAAAVTALDQASKALVLFLFPGNPVAVLPFFNLTLVWNRGVSFGLFGAGSAAGPYVLSVLSFAIVAVLGFWLRRCAHVPLRVALAAVIGGAAGNVVDRLRFGAVVDFLDFHLAGWHYPAFNVADSAIVLGIAFAVFDGLFLEPKRKQASSHALPD